MRFYLLRNLIGLTAQEEVNGTNGTPCLLIFRSNPFMRRGSIDENYYITIVFLSKRQF